MLPVCMITPFYFLKNLLLLLAVIPVTTTAFSQTKITVSKDGKSNFTSVQAAFNAIPTNNSKPVLVFVKKGTYKEKLLLDSTKKFVTLVGEDRNSTILTYDDHTGRIDESGRIINTHSSASFFMYPNNFTAENITFENNAGFDSGQAVAVFAYGDKAVFKNCRFLGFQDVLFTPNSNSRQYYRDCYIEGTTDFIFGPATVLFENCTIHSKKNSHVTAASTPQEHPIGYVFKNCKLTGDTSLHNVSLGRPWKPYASVTYLNCYIGKHILAEGWNNWKNTANESTARFAEYGSYGPGANNDSRVKWSRQLSKAEAAAFTTKAIFGDWKPSIN